MKVVVTGGRDYADRELVFIVLDRIHKETPISMLIHGACGWDADDINMSTREIRGADGHADVWARDRDIPFERVPAAWTSLGPKAGPIRNGLMLDRKPDLVVAFPGERGTWNCVKQARKRRIVVEHAARTTAEARAALHRDVVENGPWPSPIRLYAAETGSDTK